MPGESGGGYRSAWTTLTGYERRLVWEHRVLGVLWEIKFGLVSATRAAQLIALCAGDQARMAFADAIMWSGDGVLNVIFQPLIGALSDAYGRKLFMALGRVSLIWWCLGTCWSTTLRQYIFNDIAPYPLFGSSLSVQAASFADVFGSRPELSSQLAARSQIFVSAAGLVGPLLGAAIVVRSRLGGWYAGAAAGALETVIVLSMSETLKPEKRTPFRWRNANPFGSLSLLFRHGPGLRRLALSALTFNACTTTYSTMDSYRLGPCVPGRQRWPTPPTPVADSSARGLSGSVRVGLQARMDSPAAEHVLVVSLRHQHGQHRLRHWPAAGQARKPRRLPRRLGRGGARVPAARPVGARLNAAADDDPVLRRQGAAADAVV